MGTRDRLIDAAQELLWERGYSAVSPKDIQSAADAGQGSMYHHFSGKESLAVAALERNAQAMTADVDALLAEDGTSIERLERYLTRQRDSLRGCRMGRMTYDAGVLASDDLLAPVSAALGALVTALASVIAQGVEAGELPPDTDAQALGSTVAAVVQGGYVLARAQRDPAPFEAAIAGAVAMLRAAQTP